MPGGDFFAPVPYASTWLVLGVALVAAVLAWYAGLAALGRRNPAPRTRARAEARPDPVPPTPLPALRAQVLELLDQAEADHRSGALDQRALALRVSALVRAFATDATRPASRDARAMALADLRAADSSALAGPVADLVDAGYPVAFARADGPTSAELMAAARRVVMTWA